MTKNKILELIDEIDECLVDCKKIIDAYAGQTVPADGDVVKLCKQSQLLVIERAKLKKKLLDEYGIFVMD